MITRIGNSITRQWIGERRRICMATLVETAGSAPLDPGATMMFDADGNVEGSVTGGCVEGALADEARAVLADGIPRMRSFGIADEVAAQVGLSCGGTVHIFLERLSEPGGELIDRALEAVDQGRPAAIATRLDGAEAGARLVLADGEVAGGLGIGLLDRNVEREMRGMLERGVSSLRRYGADGATMGDEIRVHVRTFAPPPSMIIFGAIDYSVAVARLARELGYEVTIVDAREPFVSSPRFSAVATIAVDWPDRFLAGRQLTQRDVVLVFTHDRKFDEPALLAAVRSGAGYVGALGSRRTQEERRDRLREAGLSEAELDRIAAPCGLDIGARTPTETAVSILAEVIAERAGRSGEPLVETSGPIHSTRDGAGEP